MLTHHFAHACSRYGDGDLTIWQTRNGRSVNGVECWAMCECVNQFTRRLHCGTCHGLVCALAHAYCIEFVGGSKIKSSFNNGERQWTAAARRASIWRGRKQWQRITAAAKQWKGCDWLVAHTHTLRVNIFRRQYAQCDTVGDVRVKIKRLRLI